MVTESSCPRRVGPATGRIGPVDAPSTSWAAGGLGALVAEFAQRTRVGAEREANEDAIGCWPSDSGVLFAVADGVGGYDDGEVASAMALEAVTRAVASTPPSWQPLKRLRRAVEWANIAVYDQGQGRMRTTLTVTLLGPRTLTTAHVGDCRLLRCRGGALRQLTTDHNLAVGIAEYGFRSASQRVQDPARRFLTRCLGQDPYVRIDTISLALHPGDVYLQCSDGIATLPESYIIETLRNHDPRTGSELLIRGAQEAGGDDTSVQVVSVLSCSLAATPGSWFDALRLGTLLRRAAP